MDTQTHEHTYTHTCSSVSENRDRSQPDHTIVQRKKSIKQQVHFSAEAFRNPSSHCRSFVGEDKKNQPPLRFHSHVREGMFTKLENKTT